MEGNDKEKPINLNILSDLKKISPEKDKIIVIINNLNTFIYKLKFIKSLNLILTSDNLLILQKIAQRKNLLLYILLSKIYNYIISNEWLFNYYLVFNEDNPKVLDKINFLLGLVDECLSIIECLQGFILYSGLFEFKNNILILINNIYIRSRRIIQDEEELDKLVKLLKNLPSKFYSKAYLEMNNRKDLQELFSIINMKNIKNISYFEEIFLNINNYYEQFEIFKKFIESNCNNEANEQNINRYEINIEYSNDNIEFYYNFGLIILKFYKCHRYIFLNQKESEEEEKNLKGFEENIKNENSNKFIFLLDKYKKAIDKAENNSYIQSNENIVNILLYKQFISSNESDEYINLIKKGINYYLNKTKNFKNDKTIEPIRQKLIYCLKTLEAGSLLPIYLNEIKNISFYDNFSPSYSLNVQAGHDKKLYLSTKYNEKELICIEFFLEDKSKDIIFEINKYDINSDSFYNIFHKENIKDAFKCFILCNGYSLYEFRFNNDYSWFNSKNIKYKISLLKLSKQNEFFCNLNGNNLIFSSELIIKKIEYKEDEKEINIPVIFYLNNLRIFSFEKNDKGDNLNCKEIIEKEEKYIPKHLFDYSLINHLIKMKINPKDKKKIVITIFSQNRDLINNSKDFKENAKNKKDEKILQYLEKIGFVPSEVLGDYKVEYKLYDLCEQILIYHLFICKYKKIPINKSILHLNFDKLVVNYSMYNDGIISTKLKEKINIDNKDSIFNLIKNANRIYQGLCVVLSQIYYNDEEKKKLIELFEEIKKYCIEKLEPKVSLFLYNDDILYINIFKYMNLFYSSLETI